MKHWILILVACLNGVGFAAEKKKVCTVVETEIAITIREWELVQVNDRLNDSDLEKIKKAVEWGRQKELAAPDALDLAVREGKPDIIEGFYKGATRWEQVCRAFGNALCFNLKLDIPNKISRMIRLSVGQSQGMRPVLDELFARNYPFKKDDVLSFIEDPKYYDYAKEVLDRNPEMLGQIGEDGSGLYSAVSALNLPMVQLLVERGVDPNKVQYSRTPLAHSVDSPSRLNIARYLIQVGADPRRGSSFEETPLGQAITHQNYDALKEVVFAGQAQVDIQKAIQQLEKCEAKTQFDRLVGNGYTPSHDRYNDHVRSAPYQHYLKLLEFLKRNRTGT